jgi:hypothetical protein
MDVEHHHHLYKEGCFVQLKFYVSFVHGQLFFLDIPENKNGQDSVQI